MQEVSGSSPLSSTGQTHNSNRSNRQYSSKVPQRRPDGPPYVCSDQLVPFCRLLAGLCGAAMLCDRELGKFAFGGACDSCRLVTTRLLRRAVSQATVAAFADGRRAAVPPVSKDQLQAPGTG